MLIISSGLRAQVTAPEVRTSSGVGPLSPDSEILSQQVGQVWSEARQTARETAGLAQQGAAEVWSGLWESGRKFKEESSEALRTRAETEKAYRETVSATGQRAHETRDDLRAWSDGLKVDAAETWAETKAEGAAAATEAGNEARKIWSDTKETAEKLRGDWALAWNGDAKGDPAKGSQVANDKARPVWSEVRMGRRQAQTAARAGAFSILSPHRDVFRRPPGLKDCSGLEQAGAAWP